MRSKHTLLLLAVLGSACAARAPIATTTVTAGTLHPKRGEGAMRPIVPSAMSGRLRAIGLDPKNLPPLETLDHDKMLRVMRLFTDSLGVGCDDCHAGLDLAADTRRKRVTKRMWNEITRVVALEAPKAPGEDAVFCDSCHQGDLFILDRRDRSKVTLFMTENYDEKLKRTDGRDHDCATCHGDPPDYAFLTKWRDSPAPDIAK